MSDRAVRAARERYVDGIRRCAAYVTAAVIIPTPLDNNGSWQIRFATNPTRLLTAPGFTFGMILDFHPQPRSQLASPSIHHVGYRYELRDRNHQKVFAYHFHPTGVSPILTPHIHVSGGTQSVRLEKRHLPTGLITFPEIIRCLITEFDVKALRPDWRAILETPTND